MVENTFIIVGREQDKPHLAEGGSSTCTPRGAAAQVSLPPSVLGCPHPRRPLTVFWFLSEKPIKGRW